MAHGSVDFTWRAGHSIIAAEDATSAYLDGGRTEAALAVPRQLFSRDLSVGAYQLLCEVAQKCGRLNEQAKLGSDSWTPPDTFGTGQVATQRVAATVDMFPLPAARLCLTQTQARFRTKPPRSTRASWRHLRASR